MAVVLVPSLCWSHKPSSSSSSSFLSSIENPSFSSSKSLIQRRHRRTIVPLITRKRSIVILNGLENDSNQKNVQDEEVKDLGVKAALSMLKFYKREISPLMPNSCRYVPTCSEYSMEAYKRYGVAKGTILTAWRLCRCNPLGGSGFDPPRWFDEKGPSEE